jgi:hypothetical protein
MMRIVHLSFAALLTAALPGFAPAIDASAFQSGSKPSKKAPPPKPIAISGCLARASNPDGFTIEDSTGKYRLSGLDIHDFLGQKVQVLGAVVETKRLKIAGGLVPNANVAGQAGAIDPVQAATAGAGGSAPTGDVQLTEFKVRSVRPLGAGCEERQ